VVQKYRSLQRFLAGKSREKPLILDFADIERQLGFPLPPSARLHKGWWANEHRTHVQARAWLEGGWRVWQVDCAGETVELRPLDMPQRSDRGRLPPGAGANEDAVITLDRAQLSLGAVRLLRDYCQEKACGFPEAIAAILNGMALERRRQIIERFRTISPRVSGDSTDLIREDRDAR